MTPATVEYAELRRTIAIRGTIRLILGPAAVAAWAAVAMSARYGDPRVQILLPLLTLTAGFEGVRALHVGVERIGRYLQAFYEGPSGLPAWEHAAMEPAPAIGGLRLSPLFAPLFALAALANALLAWDPLGLPLTLFWSASHAAFLIRVLMVTRACRRQRASDLAHFRALQSRRG